MERIKLCRCRTCGVLFTDEDTKTYELNGQRVFCPVEIAIRAASDSMLAALFGVEAHATEVVGDLTVT